VNRTGATCSSVSPFFGTVFELLAEWVGISANAALPGLEDRLTLPLLTRAPALLQANLRAHDAERSTLEWGWLENRCALTKRKALDAGLGARGSVLGAMGDGLGARCENTTQRFNVGWR
jgi:hypothetical protein